MEDSILIERSRRSSLRRWLCSKDLKRKRSPSERRWSQQKGTASAKALGWGHAWGCSAHTLPVPLQLPLFYSILLPSPHWSSKLLPPPPDANLNFLQHPFSPSSVFPQCSYFYFNNHHITLYINFLNSLSSQLEVISFKSSLSYSSLNPWCLAVLSLKNIGWSICVKCARQAHPYRQEADLWLPGVWGREDKEGLLNSVDKVFFRVLEVFWN